MLTVETLASLGCSLELSQLRMCSIVKEEVQN